MVFDIATEGWEKHHGKKPAAYKNGTVVHLCPKHGKMNQRWTLHHYGGDDFSFLASGNKTMALDMSHPHVSGWNGQDRNALMHLRINTFSPGKENQKFNLGGVKLQSGQYFSV